MRNRIKALAFGSVGIVALLIVSGAPKFR